MDIAESIRAARQRCGLSQRDLAARAGTSAAAICLYERGERVPRVDTATRILAAADVHLELRCQAVPQIDHRRNADDLWQVLELADLLPQRHTANTSAPRFAKLAVAGSGGDR